MQARSCPRLEANVVGRLARVDGSLEPDRRLDDSRELMPCKRKTEADLVLCYELH